MSRTLSSLILFSTLTVAGSLAAQSIPLKQWKPVPNVTPDSGDLSKGSIFIPVAPCRLVDTRNAVGTFGGPSFPVNGTRTFPVPSGPCTRVPEAAAYSLNFTIVNYHVGGGGFITAWPSSLPRPFVSTLNFGAGAPLANAAVVPASSGSMSVYASDATDLIIDLNGYYMDSRASLNGGDQLWLVGSADAAGLIQAQNNSSLGNIYTSGIRGIVTTPAFNVAGVIGESTGQWGNFGVKGVNDFGSQDAAGVLGYSISRTSPAGGPYWPAGVRGEISGMSQHGYGVLGISTDTGVDGVRLDSQGNIAVQGVLAYQNWGVLSLGDLAGTGTKAFLDPHPTDASKEIRYVALEGPEAGTYFRGRGRFVNRQAVIDVPENFRMVTEEEGMTVHITPIGGAASVGVTSMTLNQIVAESTRDLEFSYIVYGVRKGYRDFEPIIESNEFTPQSADARMPAYLNAAQKQRLIDNGTYNADGTVNLRTAQRLGWDRKWARQ